VVVLYKASPSPTAPIVSNSALPSARGTNSSPLSTRPSATARTASTQPPVLSLMDAATCFALPTDSNIVVDPMV
jgi:hypothetical protein